MRPEQIDDPKVEDAKREDLTGRSKFGRNVAFAWGGYLVNVVAGFIMPRLISDRLGQTTLGIWDFTWSFVSYFALVQLGMSGSVNRFVARYRSLGDWERLSCSVSTVALFVQLAGLLVIFITVGACWWLLPFFRSRLGDYYYVSQRVLLLLGLEVAVSVALSV